MFAVVDPDVNMLLIEDPSVFVPKVLLSVLGSGRPMTESTV